MASDDVLKSVADFQSEFGLAGTAPNQYEQSESEPSQPITSNDQEATTEVADSIALDEGGDRSLSLESAQEIMGLQAQRPAPVETAAADAEEMPEEGTDEWALRLLHSAAGGTAVEAEADPATAVDPELARLRTEVAVNQALLQERETRERMRLVSEEEPEEEDVEFNTDYYTSPDVVSGIAEDYELDPATAKIVAQIGGVMVDHYHRTVAQPGLERVDAKFDARQRKDLDAENERETLGNIVQAGNHFKESGMALEARLVEQLTTYGVDKSFVGQYLLQDQNRFFATTPQGMVDAVQTVARKVATLAAQSDTGVNRKSKKGPVGQQRHSSVGAAVRRGPTARATKTADPDDDLRSRIRNAGRPGLHAFLGS